MLFIPCIGFYAKSYCVASPRQVRYACTISHCPRRLVSPGRGQACLDGLVSSFGGVGHLEQSPSLSFAGLLRHLRVEARLTQEELAEKASLSPRSISDLERGINRTARKDTAVLLAEALELPAEMQ